MSRTPDEAEAARLATQRFIAHEALLRDEACVLRRIGAQRASARVPRIGEWTIQSPQHAAIASPKQAGPRRTSAGKMLPPIQFDDLDVPITEADVRPGRRRPRALPERNVTPTSIEPLVQLRPRSLAQQLLDAKQLPPSPSQDLLASLAQETRRALSPIASPTSPTATTNLAAIIRARDRQSSRSVSPLRAARRHTSSVSPARARPRRRSTAPRSKAVRDDGIASSLGFIDRVPDARAPPLRPLRGTLTHGGRRAPAPLQLQDDDNDDNDVDVNKGAAAGDDDAAAGHRTWLDLPMPASPLLMAEREKGPASNTNDDMPSVPTGEPKEARLEDVTTVAPCFFPLDFFDDKSWETLSNPELKQRAAAQAPAHSRWFFADGTWAWRRCIVHEYDAVTTRFSIQWSHADAPIGTGKWATRLNVRFDDENHDVFQQRVETAIALRFAAEAEMRMQMRVARMPTDDTPQMAHRTWMGILRRVGGMSKKRRTHPRVKRLQSSFRRAYQRAINRMALEAQLLAEPQVDWTLPVPVDQTTIVAPAPASGVVAVPSYPFAERIRLVSEHVLVANPVLSQTLTRAWLTVREVETMLLMPQFSGLTEETRDLTTFSLDMSSYLTQQMQTVREVIPRALTRMLVEAFDNEPNDRKQSVLPRYDRLLSVLNRMYAAAVRTAMISAVQSLVDRFRVFNVLEDDPLQQPQLRIDLTVDSETGEMSFAPTLTHVSTSVLALLDELVTAADSVTGLSIPAMGIGASTLSSTTATLAVLPADDAVVVKAREALVKTMGELGARALTYMQQHQEWGQLASADPTETLAAFKAEQPSLVDIAAKLTELQKNVEIADVDVPLSVRRGLFRIGCDNVKQHLRGVSGQMMQLTLAWLNTEASSELNHLYQHVNEIEARLVQAPATPEEYAEYQAYLDEISEEQFQYAHNVNAMMRRYDVLERFQFDIGEDNFALKWTVFSYKKHLLTLIEQAERQVSVEKVRMIRELRVNQRDLEKEAFDLIQRTTELDNVNDLDDADRAGDKARDIMGEMRRLQALGVQYNKHEGIKSFEPMYTLWSTASDWFMMQTKWLATPFCELSAESVESRTFASHRTATKLIKAFRGKNDNAFRAASDLKARVESFKEHIPLIRKLRHPGIKTRHWEQLSQQLGFYINPSADFTLEYFLMMRLDQHSETVGKITEVAISEYTLESALDKMISTMRSNSFTLVPYKDTNSMIIKATDDLVATIDDQAVTTQAMLSSPYVKPLEKRVLEWMAQLRKISDILEEWINVQRSWLYLSPIFKSEDIRRQMPSEFRRFQAVNSTWDRIMNQVKRSPRVLTVCGGGDDVLLLSFRECAKLLDAITKGLNDYLDTKRNAFPRFYFLSNDELLEILARCRDPRTIQAHLRKCFENIAHLAMVQVEDNESDEDNSNGADAARSSSKALTAGKPGLWKRGVAKAKATVREANGPEDRVTVLISSMSSAEGEKMKFTNPVRSCSAIETWLCEVELAMQVSVQRELHLALREVECLQEHDDIEQWIFRWPGQVVLTANQIHFTRLVERALAGDASRALKTVRAVVMDQLSLLTRLVQGSLTKLQRKTLGCLLVFSVHNRDIVASLIRRGVCSPQDFEWTQQLRYYWFSGDGNLSRRSSKRSVMSGMRSPRRLKALNSASTTSVLHSNASRSLLPVPSSTAVAAGAAGASAASGKRQGAAVHARSPAQAQGMGALLPPARMTKVYDLDDSPGHCVVRMVHSELAYGYEYLGNTSRLVITPLTDRCYRTLFCALDLRMGGAPSGPAGTGKTETVKDLAKAVAKQCIVFNCSEGLDFRAMGKFFKGLASSGAWACYDEFDRIDSEVLSVIAQQMMTIQHACVQQLEFFIFEGSMIRLDPTNAVFITRNPGYAGRSQLPDNLKALFRPMAMMVADFEFICEILLFSEGFTSATALATKITRTLRLASEQLSKQDHYDFGMRTVKSVLTTAGTLKRALPQHDEPGLVLRALRECNLPKFVNDDIPLFLGILTDLFPQHLDFIAPVPIKVAPPIAEQPALRGAQDSQGEHEETKQEDPAMVLPTALAHAARGMALQAEPDFINKCMQLHETVAVRNGVMLVGATFGGKTSVLQCLAAALTALAERGSSEYRRVYTATLNPKAISMGRMYGEYDDATYEWTDGIVAHQVREMSSSDNQDLKWLIFDGPVDSVWIESMNTVLDDNKLLCLTNGERITIPKPVTMVFEVDNLSQASPATISRCGMVFIDPAQLSWRFVVASWLQAMHRTEFAAMLSSLIDDFVPDALNLVLEQCTMPLRIAPNALVRSLTTLIDALVERLDPTPVAASTTAKSAANASSAVDGTAAAPGDAAAVGGADAAGAAAGNGDVALPADAVMMPGDEEPGEGVGVASGSDGNGTGADLHKQDMNLAEQLEALECLFLFAIVWSIGGALDTPSRPVFDQWMREKMKSARCQLPMPGNDDDLDVYAFYYDLDRRGWEPWLSLVPSYELSDEVPLSRAVVPTFESIRNTYLAQLLVSNHFPFMLCGPSGCGKTASLMSLMAGGLSDKKWVSMNMPLSASTTSEQVQAFIEHRLERRGHVLSAPKGKHAVVFLDDANTVIPGQYGATPALELLRQALDAGRWYEQTGVAELEIENLQLVAAMAPPGGGRNALPPRFQRHFNVVYSPEITTESLDRILTKMMQTHTQQHSMSLKELRTAMVVATLDVFQAVRTKLRPIPSRPHYIFNTRDVFKVVIGLLAAHKERVSDRKQIVRLWFHECLRVFGDRLIDTPDRTWFSETLKAAVQEHFHGVWVGAAAPPPEGETDGDTVPDENAAAPAGGSGGGSGSGEVDYAPVLGTRLLFGDLLNDDSAYEEMVDLRAIWSTVESALSDYNQSMRVPMEFTFFEDAVEHVCRIARIVRQVNGHALLVGLIAGGLLTMARLAVYVNGYDVFQVQVTSSYGMIEWRDDLKTLIKDAGLREDPIVFLIDDTQVFDERVVEDLVHVMQLGEVPDLFEREEIQVIIAGMRQITRDDALLAGATLTPEDLLALFMGRVRNNLRVITAMNPLSHAFRDRLRRMPALVTCTTVDWFDPWPRDALQAVARSNLGSSMRDADVSVEALMHVAVGMHESVEQASTAYLKNTGRQNLVTPPAFLDLLTTFSSLVKKQRATLQANKARLAGGVEKIDKTREDVALMQQELEELLPVLDKTTKELESLLVTLTRDQREADETKAIVEREEACAIEEANLASEIRESALSDLSKALPALESATKALNALNKNDIVEIKGMLKPPPGLTIVIEAVCIMMGRKPRKVDNPLAGRPGQPNKIDDYWPEARNMMNDPHFIQNILRFERDAITEDTIKKVSKYIKNPSFTPEAVAKISQAAKSLCSWVRAMEMYYWVAKQVAPKKKALEEANAKLKATEQKLAERRAQLQQIMSKMASLRAEFTAGEQRKAELQNKVHETQLRLSRATKLIGGLGNEGERWKSTVKEYSASLVNVYGDMLLSAGAIAYCGALTSVYRSKLLDEWRDLLTQHDISFTSSYSLASALSTPVKIQHWVQCGLPYDTMSIENAIIVTETKNYPLMIDPQGQAIKWIKQLEKAANLVVCRTSNPDFLRTLGNAITFGVPVLIENLDDTIDPVLEPLLLQQTETEGGQEMVRLGDKTIPLSSEFRLYMTTKLANPTYAAHLQSMLAVVNFSITPEGLQDQLLTIVVARERPDLDELKNELVQQSAENRRVLKATEDRILDLLANSKGNLLTDEVLIDTLASSKQTSDDLQGRMQEAEATEAQIDKTRSDYSPMAERAVVLFFCVVDLGRLDPMYLWSLDWLINLFHASITNAGASEDLATRLRNLVDEVTYAVYANVCRSLFERHKLMLSILLTSRVLASTSALDDGEWRFLIAGPGLAAEDEENPLPRPDSVAGWMTQHTWTQLRALSTQIPALATVAASVRAEPDAWRGYFLHATPHSLPVPGHEGISSMQRMLVLRCLRPDKIEAALQAWVVAEMGRRFIEPPTLNLEDIYADSDVRTPIVVVLSDGMDPTDEIFDFAGKKQMKNRIVSISLGQGQGPLAEVMIKDAIDLGNWVLLQNCHLAASWMPSLERVVESVPVDRAHPRFRLWLTSKPTSRFPPGILQAAVKLTNEAPTGLRANLLRTLTRLGEEEIPVSVLGKRLMFSMAFFHSVMQERRKFGPLGWNNAYEFNESDIQTSLKQLRHFVDAFAEPALHRIDDDTTEIAGWGAEAEASLQRDASAVPFTALQYLVGEINYGGRVTDERDRRTVAALLTDFVRPEVVLTLPNPEAVDTSERSDDGVDDDQESDDASGDDGSDDGSAAGLAGKRRGSSSRRNSKEASGSDRGHDGDSDDSGAKGRQRIPQRLGYAVSGGNVYRVPECCNDIERDILPHVANFPINDDPSVFGMHRNAEISSSKMTGQRLCATLMQLQSSGVVAASSSLQSQALQHVQEIMAMLPPRRFTQPTRRDEANASDADTGDGTVSAACEDVDAELILGNVLRQEQHRYSTLLRVVHTTINGLLGALRGDVTMTSNLEAALRSIQHNEVPQLWKDAAYPSCKNLTTWLRDLRARVAYIQEWTSNGAPTTSWWLGGLFYPQGLLTAVTQLHARRTRIAIDSLVLSSCVVSEADAATPPSTGIYITGLFLEGARWDADKNGISEARDNELFSSMIPVHVFPVQRQGGRGDTPASRMSTSAVYSCPLYRTIARGGSVTTTGAHTNYVMMIDLAVANGAPPKHWIKRGTALFLGLPDV